MQFRYHFNADAMFVRKPPQPEATNVTAALAAEPKEPQELAGAAANDSAEAPQADAPPAEAPAEAPPADAPAQAPAEAPSDPPAEAPGTPITLTVRCLTCV